MRGSSITKVARLAWALIRRPQDGPRYLTMRRRSPLELRLPWFSFGAIDFLSGFLRPTMRVFEYGSGGSTLYFADRTAEVVSVEDNAEWKSRVQLAVDRPNIRLELHPFDFERNTINFGQSAYLHALDQRYDVIVVDGTELSWPVRLDCFARAQHFIKPGGVIVLDDAWRYPLARVMSHANICRDFKSVGPARPGVTTTQIHFY
jgi:predicted O-methyltransferase YrrM